jgi:hypothetical protein
MRIRSLFPCTFHYTIKACGVNTTRFPWKDELTPLHLKIFLKKISSVLLDGNPHDKSEGRSIGIHVRCVCKGTYCEVEMRSERILIPFEMRC